MLEKKKKKSIYHFWAPRTWDLWSEARTGDGRRANKKCNLFSCEYLTISPRRDGWPIERYRLMIVMICSPAPLAKSGKKRENGREWRGQRQVLWTRNPVLLCEIGFFFSCLRLRRVTEGKCAKMWHFVVLIRGVVWLGLIKGLRCRKKCIFGNTVGWVRNKGAPCLSVKVGRGFWILIEKILGLWNEASCGNIKIPK